jgi:hypothetical protein
MFNNRIEMCVCLLILHLARTNDYLDISTKRELLMTIRGLKDDFYIKFQIFIKKNYQSCQNISVNQYWSINICIYIHIVNQWQ